MDSKWFQHESRHLQIMSMLRELVQDLMPLLTCYKLSFSVPCGTWGVTVPCEMGPCSHCSRHQHSCNYRHAKIEVYKTAFTVSLSEPKNLVVSMILGKFCLTVLLHHVFVSFFTFLCRFMNDCQGSKAECNVKCFSTVPLVCNVVECDHMLNTFIA
jgi:hypothetical protein